MERGELAQLAADIAADIVKAGGANYDLGNTRTGVKAGATASIKTQSAAFFRQKDAETEIRGIVFEKRVREEKTSFRWTWEGGPWSPAHPWRRGTRVRTGRCRPSA